MDNPLGVYESLIMPRMHINLDHVTFVNLILVFNNFLFDLYFENITIRLYIIFIFNMHIKFYFKLIGYSLLLTTKL